TASRWRDGRPRTARPFRPSPLARYDSFGAVDCAARQARAITGSMTTLASFGVAVLAAVLLATPVGAQTPRDVFVVGMEAEPPGPDPGQALGLHTLRVTAEIFGTLVATAVDRTDFVPGLADPCATSCDGRSWTSTLPTR